MSKEIIKINCPIDGLRLIYKALRLEAARVEKLVQQLEIGGSLQGFKVAFNSWATVLVYQADQEDAFITERLTNIQPSGQGEPHHPEAKVNAVRVTSWLNTGNSWRRFKMF